MKNRRYFMAEGLFCTIGLSAFGMPLSGAAWVQDENDTEALCSTDETLLENDLEIIDLGTGDTKFDAATAMSEFKITDFGTALSMSRWRRSDGLTPNTGLITLGCFFMSGTEQQRRKVRDAAQGWLTGGIEQVISFDFTVPQDQSQIRIMLPGEANNSFIGRAALQVPHNKHTMQIKNIETGTIQHEFGHALGLLHEHMHPEFNAPLNEEQIIADMRREPNNWGESQTRLNIINRLGSNAACVGDPAMNPTSIMMYNIPSRWTRNGQSFRRSNSINERDLRCVQGLYM